MGVPRRVSPLEEADEADVQVGDAGEVSGAASGVLVAVEAGVPAVAVVAGVDESGAYSGVHLPAAGEVEAVAQGDACHEGFATGAGAEEGVVVLAATHGEADVGAAECAAGAVEPVAQFAACAPRAEGVGAVARCPEAEGGVGGKAPTGGEVEFGAEVGGEGGPGEEVGGEGEAGRTGCGGGGLRYPCFVRSLGFLRPQRGVEGQCQQCGAQQECGAAGDGGAVGDVHGVDIHISFLLFLLFVIGLTGLPNGLHSLPRRGRHRCRCSRAEWPSN